jgi:microcystin degradation protein MlrC
MLAALLKHELPAGDCIVQGPVDKTAVDACIAAGVGATVELSLGGKMDPVNAAPLAVTATVVFVQPEAREYTVRLHLTLRLEIPFYGTCAGLNRKRQFSPEAWRRKPSNAS